MIPAEAVEAMMDAAQDSGFVLKRSQAHDWLEAAAPHMQATTWDKAYHAGFQEGAGFGPTPNPYRSDK